MTKSRPTRSFLSPTQEQSASLVEEQLIKGNFSEAYNEALAYVEKFPDATESHYYLGETLFQLGKYKESISQFQIALNDNQLDKQKKSNIYYLIGRGYDYSGDIPNAIAHFQTAIDINPSNALAYDGLGIQLTKEMKYTDAITAFTKELSLIFNSDKSPSATSAYYYLAKIRFKMADYSEAQKNIETAEALFAKLPQPKPELLLTKILDLKSAIAEMVSPAK
ncbi:MAG: tetratricopeptide repeat protein [Candidatus Parcubacteria bacterium]|nr:tetratricopeptide repeat protein [Candidatus Parcubacteria bacterium]